MDGGTDNNVDNNVRKADFLIRSHTPGQNTFKERMLVLGTVKGMLLKVKSALQNTVIDIGKDGSCQYGYNNDILYVVKGDNKTAVIHEIGHIVENKLLDAGKVAQIREAICKNILSGSVT